ncbi:MAG: hypothetical protein V1495_01355 [Pseudomonadota bacterium]
MITAGNVGTLKTVFAVALAATLAIGSSGCSGSNRTNRMATSSQLAAYQQQRGLGNWDRGSPRTTRDRTRSSRTQSDLGDRDTKSDDQAAFDKAVQDELKKRGTDPATKAGKQRGKQIMRAADQLDMNIIEFDDRDADGKTVRPIWKLECEKTGVKNARANDLAGDGISHKCKTALAEDLFPAFKDPKVFNGYDSTARYFSKKKFEKLIEDLQVEVADYQKGQDKDKGTKGQKKEGGKFFLLEWWDALKKWANEGQDGQMVAPSAFNERLGDIWTTLKYLNYSDLRAIKRIEDAGRLIPTDRLLRAEGALPIDLTDDEKKKAHLYDSGETGFARYRGGYEKGESVFWDPIPTNAKRFSVNSLNGMKGDTINRGDKFGAFVRGYLYLPEGAKIRIHHLKREPKPIDREPLAGFFVFQEGGLKAASVPISSSQTIGLEADLRASRGKCPTEVVVALLAQEELANPQELILENVLINLPGRGHDWELLPQEISVTTPPAGCPRAGADEDLFSRSKLAEPQDDTQPTLAETDLNALKSLAECIQGALLQNLTDQGVQGLTGVNAFTGEDITLLQGFKPELIVALNAAIGEFGTDAEQTVHVDTMKKLLGELKKAPKPNA